MPYLWLAAALIAALPVSAFAQGTTTTPCPPDNAKAKTRKILGSILTNPQLKQSVTGQPCVAPAPPAPAQSAPPNAPVTAQTADPQPKPGTSIAGGDVALAPAAATPEEPKAAASGPAIPVRFGQGVSGMLPFNGGGGVKWLGDRDETLQVWMVSRETGPREKPMEYEGHDGKGNHYLTSIDATTQHFKLTAGNGVARIQAVQEVPEGLNRIPEGSSIVVRNVAGLAGKDGPSPGIESTSPLTLIDDTSAVLALPDGKGVMVTRENRDSKVWKDQKGNRYMVKNDRVVELGR